MTSRPQGHGDVAIQRLGQDDFLRGFQLDPAPASAAGHGPSERTGPVIAQYMVAPQVEDVGLLGQRERPFSTCSGAM